MMAGIPKSSIVVVEKKGLRPDRTRPGDVVVLNASMAQADTYWSLML